MRISHVPLKRSSFPPPTGFRAGWKHSKTAISRIIESDVEEIPVNRLDYAADDSDDDTKEATSVSTARPLKGSRMLTAKVCLINSILNSYLQLVYYFYQVRYQNQLSQTTDPRHFVAQCQTSHCIQQFRLAYRNPETLANNLPSILVPVSWYSQKPMVAHRPAPRGPAYLGWGIPPEHPKLAVTGEPIFYLVSLLSIVILY
jgi:hypothetical protein